MIAAAALSLAWMLGGVEAAQNFPSDSAFTGTQLLPPREASPSLWFIAGSAPKSYHLGSEGLKAYKLSAYNAATADDFETVFHSVVADKLRGKRVRMAFDISTRDTPGGVGLWMRADDKSGKAVLLKDSEKNLIIGSTEWKTYELTAEVPADAVRVGYGLVLVGKGEVLFRNAQIEAIE